MAKGAQNRDSKLAYDHAKKSIGKHRKCNGIFHKGYANGDKVDAASFKRMGDGYQAFCSDCDLARQNMQKTLKRIAALVFANPKYKLNLGEEFADLEIYLNNKIKKVVSKSKNSLEVYTNLVFGKDKLNIKELGLYEPTLSVSKKKKLIDVVNSKVRNYKNNSLVATKLTTFNDSFSFQCSKCKEFFPLSEAHPNISQSRDLFLLNNTATSCKLPLHNICDECTKGTRSESIRHFKYLCDGNFIEASKKMTQIGKLFKSKNMHADHIIPLRLGGKHTPENIRPISSKENIEKRDKLTKEVITYLKKNNIDPKSLLTEWYHLDYEKTTIKNVNLLEIALRHAVDAKRKKITNLSLIQKKEALLELYPVLNDKELNRIIKKCFS